MATINISLPKSMYEDTKKMIRSKRYASVSELVRDALRKMLYPELTENGFTPEFEEQVLRSAAEPRNKDMVWETEEDIRNFFRDLKTETRKKNKNAKD